MPAKVGVTASVNSAKGPPPTVPRAMRTAPQAASTRTLRRPKTVSHWQASHHARTVSGTSRPPLDADEADAPAGRAAVARAAPEGPALGGPLVVDAARALHEREARAVRPPGHDEVVLGRDVHEFVRHVVDAADEFDLEPDAAGRARRARRGPRAVHEPEPGRLCLSTAMAGAAAKGREYGRAN